MLFQAANTARLRQLLPSYPISLQMVNTWWFIHKNIDFWSIIQWTRESFFKAAVILVYVFLLTIYDW